MNLGRAYSISASFFRDKKDAQGRPYFEHCLEVAKNSEDDDERICSLLHDVPEDCFKTIEEGLAYLREAGFSEKVIRIIDILSHRDEDDYLGVYIKKIAMDPVATKIKKKDLRHNSDLTRIKGQLTKKHFDKVEKYHSAYIYLSKI